MMALKLNPPAGPKPLRRTKARACHTPVTGVEFALRCYCRKQPQEAREEGSHG
jgi:hypothetical protein